VWTRPIVAVVAACVGLVLPLPLQAAASPAGPTVSARVETQTVGLWDPGYSPGALPSQCGTWALDAQGFCTADDVRNGVELGMKFQSSVALQVTGIRVYRVDSRTITGSLWHGDGTRLATGAFADTGTLGWQDLVFPAPVTIRADRTYLATYYSPATRYAFSYGYYADPLTRGPITALRSVTGDPNGVHCYDVASCDYPKNGFRSSNYWVTPLWEVEAGAPVPPQPVPAPPVDSVAPTVRAAMPRGGEKRIGLRATIKVTFSEAVRPALLIKANVRLLRVGQRAPVATRLRYDERRHRLSLDPRGGLRPRSTYRVVISSAVVDTAGNRLDQDPRRAGAQRATWTFRTR
jgi:hypothetical protein